MEYKTPEIKNLMEYVGSMHPMIEEKLKALEEQAAEICLGVNREGRETVEHSVMLGTGENVYLLWDVEYLVNYSLMQPERMRLGSPYEIINTVEVGNSCIVHKQNRGSVVVSYGQEDGEALRKDVSFMIVASIPSLNTKCIMDGSHGFYDSLIENRPVRYFPITAEECKIFLQPESRRFVELCERIDEIVAKSRKCPNVAQIIR